VMKYSVHTIPRYMIIGKDGSIKNADALRPSNPSLEIELISFLNN
jgi:hypothetical protein